MVKTPWKALALCTVAVFALVAITVPAIADHHGEKKMRVKKIVKCEDGDCTETIEELGEGDDIEVIVGGGMKKIVKCKGGDCTETIEGMGEGEDVKVIVGDGMKKKVHIRKVKCDGDDCEEHEGMHNMVFVGEGGEVKVMSGDGGNMWVSRMGDHGGTYLGVGLTELTPELRAHFGVPEDAGVMVSKVMEDSPAFKAGLRVGDIIAGVDGNAVGNGAALAGKIRKHGDGDEVALEVWRGGSAQTITAAVEERKGTLHAEHMGGMHKRMKKIKIECDSEDGDCESNMDISGLDEFDCGGAEECEVRVECEDGGCTCTINGESADCSGIPGVPSQ